MFFFDEEMIENKCNNTAIEQITIKGLFGKNDVTLNFEKEVNIYIGENGLGKTTILNCIYYILCNNYEKLISISFSKIYIKFKNIDEISICKEDVLRYLNNRGQVTRRYSEADIFSYIKSLIEPFGSDKNVLVDDELKEMIIRKLIRFFHFPYSVALSYIISYYTSNKNIQKGEEKNINKLRETLSKNVTERVIYLTTYRRIEKDYSDYFNPEIDRFDSFNSEIKRYNNMEDSLIRFGMKDVSNAINTILETIRNCFKITYTLGLMI